MLINLDVLYKNLVAVNPLFEHLDQTPFKYGATSAYKKVTKHLNDLLTTQQNVV
jgi:hypothetical protein